MAGEPIDHPADQSAAPAPVVEAAAPVVASAPEAAPAAAPAEIAAPVASAEPLVSDTPSLLESVGKEEPKEGAESAPAEGEKTEKPKESAEVAAAPKTEVEKPKAETPEAELLAKAEEKPAWKFELPAVLKESPKEMGEFTTILDGFAKDPVKSAQGLLNLHAQAMEAYAKSYDEQALAAQHRTFNEMRSGWNKQIMSDPELGGAGFETSSKAVARMRDMLASHHKPGTPQYAKDYAELESFMRITGAGDHPVFWRILHNAARYLDEPQAPSQIGKPTKANGQARAGASLLYDNPRSNIGGQA